LQRVREARVTVQGEAVGSVGRGLLVLLGVGHGDDEAVARKLADKVAGLRIFEDEQGKTNLSVAEVAGEVLVVSQFTLYADARKGRRPSFTDAAEPSRAAELVEAFRGALTEAGLRTETGQFAAHMQVSLVNDGPFTIWLDSERLWGGRE
jgi:D-tyrosyl-tRNA(Tyr) deacylase